MIAVMTSPETFERVWAAENTWVQHTTATVLYIMGNNGGGGGGGGGGSGKKASFNLTRELNGTRAHPFLDRTLYPPPLERIIQLPGVSEEGSHQITRKTIAAWEWLWRAYPDKKWFYKCDDDTYVMPHNFLHVLAEYDADHDHYMGRVLYGDFASGGAGYFMSRGLLPKAVPELLGCLERGDVAEERGEDVVIGYCLRDRMHLRVNNIPDLMLYLPRQVDRWQFWDADYKFYSSRPGSIHYVSTIDMFELDYFVYTMIGRGGGSGDGLDDGDGNGDGSGDEVVASHRRRGKPLRNGGGGGGGRRRLGDVGPEHRHHQHQQQPQQPQQQTQQQLQQPQQQRSTSQDSRSPSSSSSSTSPSSGQRAPPDDARKVTRQ